VFVRGWWRSILPAALPGRAVMIRLQYWIVGYAVGLNLLGGLIWEDPSTFPLMFGILIDYLLMTLLGFLTGWLWLKATRRLPGASELTLYRSYLGGITVWFLWMLTGVLSYLPVSPLFPA